MVLVDKIKKFTTLVNLISDVGVFKPIPSHPVSNRYHFDIEKRH